MKTNAKQISFNGDIFSIDTNTLRVYGVQINNHAGDFNDGDHHSFFPAVTLRAEEFGTDEPRIAYIEATHAAFNDHGMPLPQVRKFAASLLASNDYLQKKYWHID